MPVKRLAFFSGALLAILIFVLWFPADRYLDRHDFFGGNSPYRQTQPANGQETVLIGAVGDIMLARTVGVRCREWGYDYPVEKMADDLLDYDLAFGNLECPIAESGRPLPGKGICFRADPRCVNALNRAGFDVLSLGNNHILDYDEEAFADTLALLARNGFKTVGAGRDIYEARRPAIVTRNGVRIAFLAYSDLADLYFSQDYPRRFQAEPGVPGVAPMRRAMMVDDVRAAAANYDVVVVSLHWGTEYARKPTPEQRELAHEMIDEGADIIIGHHPHVFQGIERYKRGVIAYSLGNFIFDQDFSLPTRQGLVLETTVDKSGVLKVGVRPVFIDKSQPRWYEGEEGKAVLNELAEYCRELSTDAVIDGGSLSINDTSEQECNE